MMIALGFWGRCSWRRGVLGDRRFLRRNHTRVYVDSKKEICLKLVVGRHCLKDVSASLRS